MSSASARAGAGRTASLLVAGAAAYLGLGVLGREMTFPGQTLALAWPAAGGSVLLLGLAPQRWWPVAGLLLAVATFGFNFGTGLEPTLSAAFVVPNVVQAFVGALVLRGTAPHLLGGGGTRPLTAPRDFLALLVTAVSSSLAAVLSGTLALWLLRGSWDALDSLLWLGRNSAGALVVLTVVVVLVGRVPATGGDPFAGLVPRGPERLLELVALVAATTGLYVLVFGRYAGLPLAFPLLVPSVWAGLRFGPRTVALHSLAVGAGVAVATLRGVGPFARGASWAEQALVSQLFIGTVLALGMLLALQAVERRALTRVVGRAHAEVSNQAALLSTVIDSMHEGLVVLDDEGRVLLRNPSAARLVPGVAAQGEVSTGSGPWVSGADGRPLALDELPFARALRGERVVAEDAEVHHGDGADRRVLRVSAQRLPFASDSGRGQAVVIYHDVTAEHAQRAALESFAHVVAHDLKGPLGTVQGWTELLEAEATAAPQVDSGEVLGVLARVSGATDTMGRLIGGLLEASTSRHAQVRLGEVDLTAVAEAVAAQWREPVTGAAPVITVDPLPAARADEVLVRQLLGNLVGNAVKYVERGRAAEVTVSGRVVGEHVEVVVADRGVGVPPGQHEAIFAVLHRAHAGSDYEGHGIGLSVCQTIVERHGGTIVARPRTTGPGTAFVFTLPAVATPAAG
ncbi:PAS fold-containing protein [Nocardioides scoriae]|uniref:Sensor-like histidine kinase SenX3 n=1 Tax=Nocardioides scoriae TaxID=642780 RepID=A0A1H1M7L3_9ACTN|nr:ATP-binding protein [Nocardioides scoriae]SDR82395.1 PAS fold-containing protein [Nocardioides scoriae]